MITLKRRKGPLPYQIVWFDPNPTLNLLPPTIYYQSSSTSKKFGLVRKPFWTLLTDLSKDPETILANMNGSTRNQVNQMEKAEASGEWVDIDTFLSFFNVFAKEKRIEGTSRSKLESFGESLRLSRVTVGDKIGAMHATIVDASLRRCRSLLSASARFEDPEQRKTMGKANRWLHWWDMKSLLNEGVDVYDWGGYAKDTQDASKLGINQFKDGFGGKLVEESHYFPSLLAGFRS